MKSPAKLALFEQTVLPHVNAAYNLARWLTRNDPDAEDIVQEAYLRAFRYFDGFHGGDGKAWLLAVVRNTYLTWRRRDTDIAKVPFDEEIHGSQTPGSKLAAEAMTENVRDCLELLPPEYREALVLRELEEMSYNDIAVVTGKPIGTVMSRLSRARQRLHDCVTARMEGASK